MARRALLDLHGPSLDASLEDAPSSLWKRQTMSVMPARGRLSRLRRLARSDWHRICWRYATEGDVLVCHYAEEES
jgi:hypothetical protein